MAIEITVYCDACGDIGGAKRNDTKDPVRRVRADLKNVGWTYKRSPEQKMRDLCPRCIEIGRSGDNP